MDGYERNFRCSGCEMQKSVLGYMERYEKIFMGNFGVDRQLLQKSVLGIVERKNFFKNPPRVNIFEISVLG